MSTRHEINRRRFLETVGAGIALPELTARAAQRQGQSSNGNPGTVEKDVVFGKGGETQLHCDIYRPSASNEKRMAIMRASGAVCGLHGEPT